MAKAPAFQFYVKDYIGDTRSLSLPARGAWMDCLCEMWLSETRGRVSKPLAGYARFWGCTEAEAVDVLSELVNMQVCNSVTERNGNITLTNRRMLSEFQAAKANNNRQARYRHRQREAEEAENNAKITPPSSSSSSSSVFSKEKTHEFADVNAAENEFVEQVINGIRMRLNLNIIRNEAGWSDTAVYARANNFSAEHVLECFDLLRQQKWRKGNITPNVVADNLANLENLRTEIAEQATAKHGQNRNTTSAQTSSRYGTDKRDTQSVLESIGVLPN